MNLPRTIIRPSAWSCLCSHYHHDDDYSIYRSITSSPQPESTVAYSEGLDQELEPKEIRRTSLEVIIKGIMLMETRNRYRQCRVSECSRAGSFSCPLY